MGFALSWSLSLKVFTLKCAYSLCTFICCCLTVLWAFCMWISHHYCILIHFFLSIDKRSFLSFWFHNELCALLRWKRIYHYFHPQMFGQQITVTVAVDWEYWMREGVIVGNVDEEMNKSYLQLFLYKMLFKKRSNFRFLDRIYWLLFSRLSIFALLFVPKL